MVDTTTVRVDRATHEQLKRLARERDATVADTVAAAVRVLRQDLMGQQLSGPADQQEADWLHADLW